jgi:hypothetical protein
MRLALLFVCAALLTSCRTKIDPTSGDPAAISNSQAKTVQVQNNQSTSVAERYENVRMDCIQNRRIISGKIVKVLPDGLVVDSGYTDLARPPLDESWLIPGAATATRATGLVEASHPDAVCIGLVFVTDLPKSRGANVKPKLYDYVNLEGFPFGQCTYTSVGDIQRTVRKFTTKLQSAAMWNFEQREKQNAPPK